MHAGKPSMHTIKKSLLVLIELHTGDTAVSEYFKAAAVIWYYVT